MKLLPLATALILGIATVCHGQASSHQLFSEGQRAFLAADYDTAKAKFAAVLETNPRHSGAQNYMRMIKVKEAQGGGGATQQRELGMLVLPEVKFREATFESALEYVKQQAAQASNNKTQINFVAQVSPETLAKPVTLSLSSVPVTAVLTYLGDLAGVTFDIQQYAVVVKPKAADPSPTAP